MNFLLRSVFIATILSSMACAHTVTSVPQVSNHTPTALPQLPPPPPKPTAEVQIAEDVAISEPEELKPIVVEGKTWSLTLPGDWRYTTEPDPAPPGHSVKNEMNAESSISYGNETAKVALMSAPIKHGKKPLDWVTSYVKLEQADKRVVVLHGKQLEINENPAIILLTVRKLNDGSEIAVIDMAIADEKNGYVLSCGGDVDDADPSASSPGFTLTCLNIARSFRSK